MLEVTGKSGGEAGGGKKAEHPESHTTDYEQRLDALSQYQINFSDLVFNRCIGSGAFGDVWVGEYKATSQCVAIKQLRTSENDASAEETYCRELETLASAKYRFIVPFVGFTRTFPHCIVTKYIPNDSLYNALRNDPHNLKLTATDMNVIAFGIADGMNFLHSKELIHRDLKSQNILIDENKMPVICDFGSSRKAHKAEELKTGEIGTAHYMAPEFIEAIGYTNKVDVYSFAMILWEILSRKLPFEDFNPVQVIYQICSGQRPPIPDVPDELKRLITECWDNDPDVRWTFEEIANAFKEGRVAIPGTNRDKFLDRISPPTYRERSTTSRSHTKSKKKTTGTNKEFGSYRGTKKINQLVDDSGSILLMNLRNLSDSNPKRVVQAINEITSRLDDPVLLQLPFWTPILRLMRYGQKEIVEALKPLVTMLSQSSTHLFNIRGIQELHTYVCSNTLDLFLYIVTYQCCVINEKVVHAVINLIKEERHKCIILLCKIMSKTENTEVYERIVNYFAECVNENVDYECGNFILRTLINHERVVDTTLALYLASKVPDNCIAGYQALFVKENPSPNLMKVPTLLVHLTTDNYQLRAVALEFVRRYAATVEGVVLSQIIDALLTVVLRYSSDNAVLLLCRFAADHQRARVLLLPGSTSIWLNVSPAKASHMMRIFCQLFKQEKFRNELVLIPEVPPFLTNVLLTDDVETFLAVCWSIRMADSVREFMVAMRDHGVADGIYRWLMNIRETRPLQAATSSLMSIAQVVYSPIFTKVVPRLLELINEGTAASLHCVMLLAKLSEYEQTLNAFIDSNVFVSLSRCHEQESVRSWTSEIARNLERSGLKLN